MPLPAALAARLAKRGIVKQDTTPKPAATVEEVEEVFAEDYDDPSQKKEQEPETDEQNEEEEEADEEPKELVYETLACPNRWIKYHECCDYCTDRWGFKEFCPEDSMLQKKERMMKKYPLPEGWQEVADPSSNRYYYWNVVTDQVSWMPPHHPRASISLPADKLREVMEVAGAVESDHSEEDEDEDEDETRRKEEDMDMEEQEDSEDEFIHQDFEEIEREVMNEKKRKEERRQKRKDKEALDPMDPASYSDIPRGTWSTGLDTRGSAKTGVDATASGPLFQQRPYPSPGAVLRANKDMPK